VQVILLQSSLGWLIRSVHRWSSAAMALFIILHVARVYFTGGFKKPREVTWISGLVLALITLVFGVTGYSLPWDKVAYWACKIVTSIPEALDSLFPGIGKFLVSALRGGVSVSQYTLTRLYSVHTFFLPLSTLVLLLVHFLIIRKQGISGRISAMPSRKCTGRSRRPARR
jgi:cytochrome b6